MNPTPAPAPAHTDPSTETGSGACATLGDGRIWLTAQQPHRTQRGDRYVPESLAHPARMLPAIAAHAIAIYTRPGDLVLDPMCGIGTSLIEAVRAGRRGIGVEYEQRWAHVAGANLALARRDGHTSASAVVRGDARQLRAVLPDLSELPEALRGQAALVLTSPPYGPSTHGRLDRHGPGTPIRKVDHRYGAVGDRANLANAGVARLRSGVTRILADAAALLRPGGHVVMTVRPWRVDGELVDLPSHVADCAREAGLTVTDRAVALLARVDDHGALVARSSFFQRDHITRRRAAGTPLHLIAHEDLIIARTEQTGHRHRPAPARRETS